MPEFLGGITGVPKRKRMTVLKGKAKKSEAQARNVNPNIEERAKERENLDFGCPEIGKIFEIFIVTFPLGQERYL